MSIASASVAPASLAFPRFETGLPAASVDRNLRQSLAACDHAQAGVVLWLAEVQRRGLCRQLGQPSLLQYATESLGMSRSRAYDLLQLARDLERLPRLRAAMAEGRLGWTKARLVARVATEASEQTWVEAAGRLGRRALIAHIAEEQDRARARREQRRRQRSAEFAGQTDLGWSEAAMPAQIVTLAAAPQAAVWSAEPGAAVAAATAVPSPAASTPVALAAAATPAAPPALSLVAGRPFRPVVTPAEEPPSTLTHRFTGLELARYEVLLEQAHRRRCVPPQASREHVLLAAMSALVVAEPAGAELSATVESAAASSRPDLAILYQIIVYRCRECAAAEVVTSRGRRRLSPQEADLAQCDARVLEPGSPNRATIAPAVRAAVLARDLHRCQAPGCGGTHFLEVHHVVPRGEGGTNQPQNLVTLCGRCHRFAHERPQLVRQWFAHRTAPGSAP